ncbi:hypothetical protein LCGC14_2748790, partial [marine sediment metagenome]
VIKDCISDMMTGHGIIALEIIRELKEEKDEEINGEALPYAALCPIGNAKLE